MTMVTKAQSFPLGQPSPIRGTTWCEDDKVLDVHDSHGFVQAVGYLKYRMNGPVLFRGQQKAYPTLPPSLFRDLHSANPDSKKDKTVRKRVSKLQEWIQTCAGVFENGTDQKVHEPLLQHYGLRTRWIDLIDNPWIALWFACNELHARDGRHFASWHFARRAASTDGKPQYAYIYALNAGPTKATECDGYWSTDQGAVLTDLRRSAPSTYLRPHSQNGWLLRRAKNETIEDTDLGDFVVGVLRVRLSLAQEWLGSGGLLSVHALFPPTQYDNGYRLLFEGAPEPQELLGRIAIVEP